MGLIPKPSHASRENYTDILLAGQQIPFLTFAILSWVLSLVNKDC